MARRNSRSILFGVIIVLLCPASMATSLSAKGRVVAVGDTPMAVSGVVASWIHIKVATHAHVSTSQMYLPYLEPGQETPRLHVECTFRYHTGDVSGFVGSEALDLKSRSIVDSFHCDH